MMTIKIRLSTLIYLSLFLCAMFCAVEAESDVEESRGKKKKKKKLALFVFIADIVLKKLFLFKLVYAFIFWVVVHKAGYFLTWFLTYLKEKKHEHIHVEHDHGHFDHFGPPSHYGSWGDQGHDGGYSSYGPYRRQAPGA